MKLRLLIAAQAAALWLAAPALADWQPVGSVEVAAPRDRDRLEAAFDKPVDRLRFTAETADVSCRSIRLTFRDGRKRKLADQRLTLSKPDVVELKGRERHLRRIDFDCRTLARAKAKIAVAVLLDGDQAGAAAPQPANNVVIQNSQANDNAQPTPGAAPVAVQPANNVVIHNSQANQPAQPVPVVVFGTQANTPATSSNCALTAVTPAEAVQPPPQTQGGALTPMLPNLSQLQPAQPAPQCQ